MNAKQLLKITLAVFTLAGICPVEATSQNKPKDPPPFITTIGKKIGPIKDRPKAPSNQHIEFAYSPVSHTGTFDFCNSNAQSLSVEIENQMSGEIHYGSVDVSYPVMDVCLEPASYSITCTAEDGSLYAGEFDIY